MVRRCVRKPRRPRSAPRARGDGPWSVSVTSVVGPCSPRTRGWSSVGGPVGSVGPLLLAHAGMVPPIRRSRSCARPAPRARGDGPRSPGIGCAVAGCSPRTRGWSCEGDPVRLRVTLLPAHAGMVPAARQAGGREIPAPRARGDGPFYLYPNKAVNTCSPRTRGWSLLVAGEGELDLVLPAHAGMVRWSMPP